MRPGHLSLSLGELIERLGGELLGDAGVRVSQVAPLASAGPGEIAYFGRMAFRGDLERTRAGAVVLGGRDREATQRARVVCANPHAWFTRAAMLFNPAPRPEPGIHPLAVVHASARVHPDAAVGAFAVIGADASIAKAADIGPGCRVGDRVAIGEATRLHPNVTIYAGCEIGARVVLHSGVVVGADGFGGALEEGRWIKFPHIGRVVIGDDVEVGANTTIDRGAMDDTVIEEGVKLDNLIQVGHNVRIGAHTTVAGCVGIAGSARIGARCVIGGAAMIGGHLAIPDGTEISGATAVPHSIEHAGRYTALFPLAEHADWQRSAARVRRLGRRARSAPGGGEPGDDAER